MDQTSLYLDEKTMKTSIVSLYQEKNTYKDAGTINQSRLLRCKFQVVGRCSTRITENPDDYIFLNWIALELRRRQLFCD